MIFKTIHKIKLDKERTLTIYHTTDIEGSSLTKSQLNELHQANTRNVKEFFESHYKSD